MPSTFFGITIGKSGMYAAQAAINTTAHNASNATTDGYSRQVVSQKASTPLPLYTSAGMAGTGVDVTGINRERNVYYDEKYWNCNTKYGNYKAKEYYMTSIEGYFSETNVDGITASYTDFCMALKDLKDNVADATVRTEVIEYAGNFAEYVNYLSQCMQTVQSEANSEIKTTVERINSIAAQIANLNKQINTLELRSGKANDLRDERDLLIDELSEYANISITEIQRGDNTTSHNEFIVKLDGKTLVDGYKYNTLNMVCVDGRVCQNDMEGLYDIEWSDGQDFNSASITLGGKLQALFEVRDGNNGENFTGTVAEGSGTVGDESIVITSTSCNDINKLNIPEQDGIIRIGTKLYYYDSFSVEITEEGYQYTFEGLKDENGNYGLKLNAEEKPISIGNHIVYKGVPYYQARLNEFVRNYAANFNTLHNQGEDLNGKKGEDFFNGICAVTGTNFTLEEIPYLESETDEEGNVTGIQGFYSKIATDEEGNILYNEDGTVTSSYYSLTALNFAVSQAILKDPQKIACAMEIDNGVEECGILDKLIELQHEGKLFKEGTVAEYLQTFTANIGVDTQQSALFATSHKNILASIDNQRMEISSVDEDEEALNLVKYKHAYDLSCKVVSVMDEIYDKLINGPAV
ncbi:MAG: flagellar hook-associated protein FlgK [Lachnospiraceae bacterium]|nr:flagellar hook-associated protein FlgK [Lachnospiraceae bacterium]